MHFRAFGDRLIQAECLFASDCDEDFGFEASAVDDAIAHAGMLAIKVVDDIPQRCAAYFDGPGAARQRAKQRREDYGCHLPG